jgi:hypothetical protein
MIAPVSYETPVLLTQLPDDEQLRIDLDHTASGVLSGFVLHQCADKDYSRLVDAAQDLGLAQANEGQEFGYETDISRLQPKTDESVRPLRDGHWSECGVTPLHADGQEGRRVLSVSRVSGGAYDIGVFRRQPKLESAQPRAIWEILDRTTKNVLYDGEVDDAYLKTAATLFHVAAGDLLVFNPSNPHMGVTTQAPRNSRTVFFWPGGRPY